MHTTPTITRFIQCFVSCALNTIHLKPKTDYIPFLENYVSTNYVNTSNWFPPCDLMYYVATYPSTLFWSQNNPISQWSGSLTLFLAAVSGIDQNWHQWIRLEFYSKLMKVNMFSNNYGYHVTCWTSAKCCSFSFPK